MSVIQRIFVDNTTAYLAHFGESIPEVHRKVISAICQCRTGERGYHVFECPSCTGKHIASSSCGNRHCPVCQNDKAAHWVYRQQLRLLPCNYFLATFTLPEQFRAVARSNQNLVYRAMFDCAAASLQTLEADKRFVGCKVAGAFGVLHTWGRQLQYHPHVHFVVPGGGLSASRDQWVASSGDFLVHVRALSEMFKGKLRASLERAGLLNQVAPDIWDKPWVVHCKHVGDGRRVLKYLGAYVFRVAISDARVVAYDGKIVTFKYQKVGSSRWRTMCLPVFEFMRRYLQHVLPHGFMKVRHYGFLSHNFAITIQKIRELICVLYELLRDVPVAVPPKKRKTLRCKLCRTQMRHVRFIAPLRWLDMT